MSFKEELGKRILILDGGMGTLLQQGLSEEEILGAYVDAGADIITTNSFNANRISQEADGNGDNAYKMAFEAAERARRIADSSDRKIWVAGSLGPTGKSLTIGTDASDPAFRSHSFEQFKDSYKEQICALVEGGADILLFETNFDALNLKAAGYALSELNYDIPAIVSATISDKSGRTLTGQTLEAFYIAIRHIPGLVAFGINCALGASAMVHFVENIASFSAHPLIFYPNAGIPDEFGKYNDSPEHFASIIGSLASRGLVNIAGGCCGTTPRHIKALADTVNGMKPRLFTASDKLRLSGLEAITIDRSLNFTNIGERTNMAGSKRFARLIEEDNYAEALLVAKAHVEGGASVIDINMDDPMVDSPEKMRTFLRYISGEPDIAKAAVMIDSSHWETIVEGLQNTQGRCIVNSISLKDGEEQFLNRAKEISRYGAAMVVMAFDEKGQAVTLDRKIEICRRSYTLLTEAGIKSEDIIFDCNILAVGTGTGEDLDCGVDFLEAVRWIKGNLPGAATSGGVSNLSFAFRGNNKVREAMHSAFLYHAVKAGLDMAIVNPQMLQIYDEIPGDLLKAVEDVIFNTDRGAVSRLTEFAVSLSEEKDKLSSAELLKKDIDFEENLRTAIVKGNDKELPALTLECLKHSGRALDVINGPLMQGMEKVGELFGDGKMFLPQVVKSAKTMKEAVEILQPYMEAGEKTGRKPVFLIATVQGDVHDIGKNITSIILQCNGFEVIDLGVMVPCTEILDKATEYKADLIGVSGLITPSLSRMEELCREMSSRGMTTPLFVGGAASSAVHTAVKLSPLYDNVHYGSDASDTAVKAKKYLQSPEKFRNEERESQQALKVLRAKAASVSCSTSAASTVSLENGFLDRRVFQDIGPATLDFTVLLPYFDWKMFMALCHCEKDSEELRAEAISILNSERPQAKVCCKFFNCHREGDDIVCDKAVFPMLRDNISLADYFPSKSSSQMGLFAVTVENGPDKTFGSYAVRACLAEAASSYLKSAFESKLPDGFRLIMPGIGYACCPDHSLKRDVLTLLPDIGIRLTASCSMMPEASICGLVIAHREAKFTDIRSVSEEQLDSYSSRRGFSNEEKATFLSIFKK